jgi:hypothetical protein
LVQIERIAANVTLLPLLLSTKPVRLHIDQVGVYLRQQPDGQWNLAVLAKSSTSEASASPSSQGPLILPNRQVEVTMTHGSLRLGPDGPVYTFEGQAGSPSLVEASVQWRVALAGPEGATLTAHGQLDNLLGAAPLTGHLDVSMSQLDLALVRALVPAAVALQPHGQIQAAHLRLMQTAAHGLSIDASLELQQVTWQNMPQAAGEGLAHVQVRLQVRWQGSQWACDVLTVHVPGGHFALRDPAWLQADETAWRGQMSFTLDVEDTQLVTQALAGLLPATLHLGGRLRVAGEVGGEVSRMPILSWDARLAGLRVALDGSLASARWEQVVMTEIVAKCCAPQLRG